MSPPHPGVRSDLNKGIPDRDPGHRRFCTNLSTWSVCVHLMTGYSRIDRVSFIVLMIDNL